ncbi:hypothetical protein ACGFIJ_36680 [Microbispora bryophytorum]|uniref:hypothetical protein n=1 Tax=Microbispora bryophytorum TaxID=1460882 RepID=UPI00371523BD
MAAAANAYEEAPPAAREAGLGVVALVVAVLVGYGWHLGFHLANAHNGLIAASWTAVGLYVVRMRPRHREGWLFVATGVVHAVMFFGRQYGLHEGPLPAASWLGWVGVWPLPLAIAAFGWMLMAFPDGRLLSRRWLGAAWGMAAVALSSRSRLSSCRRPRGASSPRRTRPGGAWSVTSMTVCNSGW